MFVEEEDAVIVSERIEEEFAFASRKSLGGKTPPVFDTRDLSHGKAAVVAESCGVIFHPRLEVGDGGAPDQYEVYSQHW